MADLPHVVTGLGDVLPHTVKVAEEITTTFQPIYFVWGYAGSGEHREGRALDFMTYTYGGGVDSPGPVRVEFGWDIARYLWRHRERLGVWYVIYRRRIISQTDPEDGWEWMEDRGGPTANHMDHVHVSFYWDAPEYRPLAEEEDDMDLNEPFRFTEGETERGHYDRQEYDVRTAMAHAAIGGRTVRFDVEPAVKKTLALVSDLAGERGAEVTAVVDAWQVPGPSEQAQAEAQAWLRDNWPTMYDALVGLAGPALYLEEETS